jgi:hypothetical protein
MRARSRRGCGDASGKVVDDALAWVRGDGAARAPWGGVL